MCIALLKLWNIPKNGKQSGADSEGRLTAEAKLVDWAG